MKRTNDKKTNKYTCLYMSLGMAFGLCFGMLTFSALDNIGVGMCFGIGLGLCFGSGIGAGKDAKINKQLEEFGYTVKAINPTPDGYDLIISDKNGMESAVPISPKTLRTEGFKPGDAVYLENGKAEQAFGKG